MMIKDGDIMKKVLYVHGLGSGAESNSAKLIRKHLPDGYVLDAPEIPQDPIEADEYLHAIQDNYDLVVGSSLGGFYAFILFSNMKKLLINPAIYPAEYIRDKVGLGEHEYFVKRNDGKKTYIIDEDYLDKLQKLAKHYYEDCLDEEVRTITKCIVSPEDELLGNENYNNCKELLYDEMVIKSYGGHRLTEEIIAKFVVPEIVSMLTTYKYRQVYDLGKVDLGIEDM